MEIRFQRVLSFCLTIILLFSMFNLAFASENTYSSSTIRSDFVSEDIINYAGHIIGVHLNAFKNINEENEMLGSSLSDYYLGRPFTAFNPITNKTTYFFPVSCDSNIMGILQVNQELETNELSSSFSKSFSVELVNLLNSKNSKEYILLTDGNNLQAFDGSTSLEIYSIFKEKNKTPVLSQYYWAQRENTLQSVSLEDMKRSMLDLPFELKGPIQPAEYKTLNVRGVSQGNHPWCWAATCAALINYYKGKSLTARNVAEYVYPDNPERGGDWKAIKKAYNHWGLYPSQTGVISFRSVKTKINSYKPMHLGLSGHSVGLIGYEDWAGSYNYEKVLILLEPNGGVHKSVTLKSNGNFDYYLSGKDAWKYTRQF